MGRLQGVEIHELGDSPWHLAAAGSGLFLGLFLLRSVYYIWFHQLSRYPGPWYAKTTNLVYYAVEATGYIHLWIARQHDRHGPTVRLGPARLSYVDPGAWADIYGGRGRGANPRLGAFPKDPWWYEGLDSINADGVVSMATDADDARHARLRRIFNPAFTEAALRRQASTLTSYADALIKRIREDSVPVNRRPGGGDGDDAEKTPAAIDAVRVFNFATFDITTELIFGESLGMLARGAYVPWVSNVFKSLKGMVFIAFPVVRAGRAGRFFMDHLLPPPVRRLVEAHMRFVKDRVDARMDRANSNADAISENPDMWDLILSSPEREKEKVEAGDGGSSDDAEPPLPLTRTEMYSNAAAFILAGSETSATLLSALVYMLLKSPGRMRRLAREVRALGGDGEDDGCLTLEAVAQLEYMHACIEEAMRMYPPLPVSSPRVVPPGGAVICREFVPADTRVGIYHYPAYHSAMNFEDPHSFRPERWLPGSGFDRDRKQILQPFSVGPRNCIGQRLANHTMRLILAKVLWHFDLELCPESDGWTERSKVFVVWEKPPLKIRARPADRAAV